MFDESRINELVFNPNGEQIQPDKVTWLNKNYFAEGLTPLDIQSFIALTWLERTFLIIDRTTL